MMRTIALLNRRLFVAGLFLSIFIAKADVQWINNKDIHGNVVDQNIVIKGKNAIVGPVVVKAKSQDVVIDVIGDASLASGSKDARLFLNAQPGQRILVNVDHNFLFKGKNNHDFLVAVEGGGLVVFTVKGGKDLTFGTSKKGGAVQVYVVMDECNPPTLLFGRSDQCGDKNVNINVSKHSCISYVARTALDSGCARETGSIVFSPSNLCNGCMFLNIADESSFLVQGRLLKGHGCFTLSEIHNRIPAGLNARMQVLNSRGPSATAALRVVNDNSKLSDLLIDPFCDKSFTKNKGKQFGFILGANGSVQVDDLAYIDYIGTRLNVVPNPDIKCTSDCGFEDAPVTECVKERNPSALVVDGNAHCKATPAQLLLNGRSAVYFRSGVDASGHVNRKTFTVDPNNITPGVGNFVLDVEGQLDVNGQTDFSNPNNSGAENALQILSLEVSKSCGTVFSESQFDANQPKLFPKRTFDRDNCDRLVRYNTAAFLINNRVNVSRAALMHTDENHAIVDQVINQRPDVASQPTYVGGETFKLCKCTDRPTIAFINGEFKIQTSAALTGVDIRVPNAESGNESFLKFYSNGFCVDNGTGRSLILGTTEGSFAAEGCAVIDRDAHLDVIQDSEQNKKSTHRLVIRTGFNNKCITEAIGNQDISDPAQCSIQTIFLGNASNISIGTNQDCVRSCGSCSTCDLCDGSGCATHPELIVNGDFMSFETRGGVISAPEVGGTIGEGAIFVDKNGTFSVGSCCRSSIATMVVKSCNGKVDLPKTNVLFDSRIGVTDWNVDPSCPCADVIVKKCDCFSNYVLDWATVKKNCCLFSPYEPKNAPTACMCPPVTEENVSGIPVIEGQVTQLQIAHSRLGDQAALRIDGGRVRELTFQKGFFAADQPVGFVVLSNFGRVGLNTSHINKGSVNAQIVLGVNGVTIVADGNGVVDVNEDLVINNSCAILRGPNFQSGQKLTFFADEDHTILVKSTGTLDLTSFSSGDIVEFAGKVNVVFEPGAQIALNGATLQVSDQAALVLQPPYKPSDLNCASCEEMTCFRVRIIGCGNVVMQNDASMSIPKNTFFAVESEPTCGCGVADIVWTLKDNAHVNLGSNGNPGGSFQIGNLTDISSGMEAQLVSFNLVLDGFNTLFEVGPRGFLGFGARVTNKAPGVLPINWSLACTHNVGIVQVNVKRGTFKHNNTFALDDVQASLFAISNSSGNGQVYTFVFNDPFVDAFKARVLGGGNLAFLGDCSGSFVVTNTTAVDLELFASKDLLNDGNQPPVPVNATASYLFNFLRVKDFTEMQENRATFFESAPNEHTLGFVCDNTIRRQSVAFIQGSVALSILRGAVAVATDNCDLQTVDIFQIQLT